MDGEENALYHHYDHADAPAQELFGYLAEPANLPSYVPAVTAAQALGEGRVRVQADLDGRRIDAEGWLEVDRDAMTLRWGVPGDHSYHGELRVTADDEHRSEVAVTLYTSHPDSERMAQTLRDTVDALTKAVAHQGAGHGQAPR